MWSVSIVVLTPRFDLHSHVVEAHELIKVGAHVSQSAVERFYVAVFSGLSQASEIELHAAPPRPFLEGLGGEFGPVIDSDRDGRPKLAYHAVEGGRHAPSGVAECGL